MPLSGALERVTRALLLLGPSSFVVFHAVVLASAARNPWFNFFKHAFSDLGAPSANDPWIFNYGLVAMGALVCLFSLGILATSESRGTAFASGLLFVSGVFLALIGVYPSGTRPHTFVATWFYVQSFLASAAMGVALLAEGKRPAGYALLLLGLLPIPIGYLVDATVGWPSVAMLEYAGAVFIAASASVASLAHWRGGGASARTRSSS